MKLFFTILLIALSRVSIAQKKYALLIGIDEYYKKQDVLSEINLKNV